MVRASESGPGQEELRALARSLVREQPVMTLATADQGAAWAAAVYYVWLDSLFYFFSDPDSRHIREALASGQAAAAIHPYAARWQEIRGLQMSGRVEPVGAGLEAARVIRAYLRKFPFTREFFRPGQAIDLEAFARGFKVKLYRFRADLVYYLDNQIRFGFRERVFLGEVQPPVESLSVERPKAEEVEP